MIEIIPLAAAFGIAVIDWVAVARQKKALEKYVKPLTLTALIFWVIVIAARNQFLENQAVIWLIIGLGFCLLGDVFLYLPSEKWFMPGLAAFLLGHVGYILSFGVFKIEGSRLVPAILLGATIIVAVILVVKRLITGLRDSGKGRMTAPVVVYSIVISYMVFSAGYKLLDSDWLTGEAVLLAGGGLLFYISDILNAWERFVSNFKNDRLVIMMTYHLGQFGIATGMVLHLNQLSSK